MPNFVEEVYVYEDTAGHLTDKTRYVWEQLMECVDTSVLGIQLDNLYYAKNLSEMIGETIPASVLTALIKRGLLHCDGKVDGLNAYSITTEIFAYYKNTYMPTKARYKTDLNGHFSRKG